MVVKESMTWRALETEAPEIARLATERFERAGIALLGSVRGDGSPRISPVEPYFVEGHLLFGAMSWSGKTRDLIRDPRCVLHSAVSDPDGSEGELKLYGRVEEIEDAKIREAPGKAWWVGRPREDARVFSLEIERAAFVSWDAERGLMKTQRWSPDAGYSEVERSYP
ncbi:MAG: pyridoxamine 5'-phosphate oxidase family protein [Gaiellaceae bacterium]